MKETTIQHPLKNDYCDRCKYCDMSYEDGGWQCKINHYLNCGQIIQCSNFISIKKISEIK